MTVRELSLFTLTVGGAALLSASQPSAASAQEQQPCIDDADCEMGFRCAYSDDEICVDRQGQPPDCAPAREGECEPTPIACEEDSDCPLALHCQTTQTVEGCAASPASGDGAAPDAAAGDGCTSMEVTLEEPRCVFDLVSCTDDSDCDVDLPCQPIGREGDCSGGAPANCPPGESCTPSEPVCTERVLEYCFPRRMDCSEDGDCRAGWQCTELPEDAQEHPIPGWEGATSVCMPEGIALYLAGRVEVGKNSSSSSDESASRGDAMGNPNAGGGEESEFSEGDDIVADGSCSVRGHVRGRRGGQPSAAALLLALPLALLRVRRRVRVRRP